MSEAVLDLAKVRRWKKYEEIKSCVQTGSSWLNLLPSHWNPIRLKHICRFAYGDALAAEARVEGEIPVYGSNGVVGTHDKANVSGPALIIGRKGSHGKLNFSVGDCFAIDTTYYVNGTCTNADLKWLEYALSVIGLDDPSQDSAVPGLSRDYAYNLWIPNTPLTEQRAIAAFLDRETARIDALVAKKQRLIELLEEKRQAVISNAVLRGINPKVETKDSEREWLGSIPHHWQTLRIADFADKITNGFVGPTRDILVPDGVRYLQSLHIKDGYVLFERGPYYVAEEWSNAHSKSILQCGDVVIVQTGAEVGQSAVIKEDFAGVNCHALIIVSSNKEKYDGEYLGRVLRSTYGRQALKVVETGAMHPHLNCNKVREIVVPQPPLDEQREIVRHIEVQESRFSRVLNSIEVGVQRLAEYRSALISAAVTGQIDVRKEVQLDE